MTAMLRIESGNRWDALALTRKLAHYHWFLVEPDLEHWDVYVSTEDERCDELPADLHERLVEWLVERQVEATTIHTPATEYVLTRQ